jgi:hypothetical protein
MRGRQGLHAGQPRGRRQRAARRSARLGGGLGAATLLLLLGCTAAHEPDIAVDAPPDLRHRSPSDGGSGPSCHGRACQLPVCAPGTTTEIVGTLYAGNGTDPVPGAAVFVPVYDLPELPPTLGCNLCNDVPFSVASTFTDFDGSFHLSGVPSGTIPVVARLGRFQRVVSMDVIPCARNVIPADPDTSNKGIRLPRKNGELASQDALPRIAVASGDYDQIECVLKRIGVDQLDMYDDRFVNNPPAIGQFAALLADPKKLALYDIVIVNCTDNQFLSSLLQPTVQDTLESYVRSGGRLYVTDWAYDVIEQVPAFAPYLCFEPQSPAGAPMCGGGPQTHSIADSTDPYSGKSKILDADMAKWLHQFSGVIDGSDQVAVDYSFVVVSSASQDPATLTKTWVQGPTPFGTRPQTVTFDYHGCGRVHFSTYNTEPAGVVDDSARWPNNCKTTVSPQERLLEYLFFNIAACLPTPG